jgi:hypothetical protein
MAAQTDGMEVKSRETSTVFLTSFHYLNDPGGNRVAYPERLGWRCAPERRGRMEICESVCESQFGASLWISSRIVGVRFRSLIHRTSERRRDCFRCRRGCRWICRIRKIHRRRFRECSRPVRILDRGRRCRRNRLRAAAVILVILAIEDSLPRSRPVTAIPA